MQHKQTHRHPTSSTTQPETTQANDQGQVTIVPAIKDAAGLEEAIKTLEPELNRTAQRYIRKDFEGAERAEDITQQALLRAFEFIQNKKEFVVSGKRLGLSKAQIARAKKMGKIVPEAEHVEIAKPAGWLHAIIRNTGCNYCISRRRLMELKRKAKMQVEANQPFDDPEHKTIYEENNRELHELVDKLPPKFATVIRLSFFEGYSLQEIAKELGCCINTVKSYKKRALKMLREAMIKQREVKDGRIGRKKRAAAA
jgi:RNA polymerase sigma factor (sigma-70 family)